MNHDWRALPVKASEIYQGDLYRYECKTCGQSNVRLISNLIPPWIPPKWARFRVLAWLRRGHLRRTEAAYIASIRKARHMLVWPSPEGCVDGDA